MEVTHYMDAVDYNAHMERVINFKEFGKATFIGMYEEFRSDARLYKLDPPYEVCNDNNPDVDNGSYEFVVVSAVYVLPGTLDEPGGDETLIFPADANGKPCRPLIEMHGSLKGEQNHEKALKRAGYKLVTV
jgi:hypothetical protein